MKKSFRFILGLGLVLGAGWVGTGCGHLESEENHSSRPWAQPATWSNGLPSNFNEGR
ncbi:MAG: hypothetical protein RJA22_3279 [Verrucomicrobiota bacterium]